MRAAYSNDPILPGDVDSLWDSSIALGKLTSEPALLVPQEALGHGKMPPHAPPAHTHG